ncbi:MAG: competence/damage-inducible protein A [Cyanobacteria bacterium]|nr:competence/damage-inducible protein A [Cyanobacteriota bacterium]MDA1021614.1 competence/damage-inducible protein A [Cyanobacteriota bacterium]
MKSEIICIGTELIIGHTVNTNATYISEKLSELGISVLYHTAIGDNPERIQQCFQIASKRADLVILTGGLGPTDDDITHDMLAEFCGAELKENPEQKKILEDKYDAYGGKGKMPSINYKQARLISGAQVIPNPIGTAIGMLYEKNSTLYMTFPGVPCEMEAMLEYVSPKLKDQLKARGETSVIASKKLRLTNITESRMAQTITEHFAAHNKSNPFLDSNPSLAPYATLGECYLRITAKAETEDEAYKLIQNFDQELHKIFPDQIFGYNDDTLNGVLAQKLKTNKLTISFAESCTGGLASKLMTDLPGSSEYTKLNIVTYANEAKEQMLGVKASTLELHGAVSAETAEEMVEGLSRISNADINVSITGVAGPDGATNEKPIGTIYVGIKYKGKTEVEKLNWIARRLSREQIRELACKKVFWKVIKLL